MAGLTGDEIEDLAIRLAHAVALAIIAGLVGAVGCAAAGFSFGWQKPRPRQHWQPFEADGDLTVYVVEPSGAALN